MIVHTETEIAAPAARVWDILTDFAAWPVWNPLIPRIAGTPRVGETVSFHLKLGKLQVPVNAEVVTADESRELRWVGPAPRWMRPLGNGSHYYQIEEIDADHVRFLHGERFGGLLVPRRFPPLKRRLEPAYAALSKALKRRAER